MNRRFFLQALGLGLVSAATIDVDRLLWVPGQRTYFLPAVVDLEDYVYSPAELAFMREMAIEAMRLLKNKTVLIKSFNRSYEATFVPHPTLNIHVPQRFAE